MLTASRAPSPKTCLQKALCTGLVWEVLDHPRQDQPSWDSESFKGHVQSPKSSVHRWRAHTSASTLSAPHFLENTFPVPYFSGLRDRARTGARGRMRWCRLAQGAGEIKGEQEPARGKRELSKQRELKTRAGYLQSEGGAGGEVRGGKLGRLAKRCALLPSAPARFVSRIHICRAHRQLCYSPAHSHEATHISLSYI